MGEVYVDSSRKRTIVNVCATIVSNDP